MQVLLLTRVNCISICILGRDELKVGIINVTGYAGMELVRILYRHPDVKITSVTGRSSAGKTLGEVFHHMLPIDLTITEDVTESVDLVFSALPHVSSAKRLEPLLAQSVRAIDISADFRLEDLSEYERWYEQHPCPQYLGNAVFGLPELHRKDVSSASLIANPGCFSTAAILAMAPAVKAGIVGADIIVDGKTGVSGAGRGQHPFSEVNESVMAYSVDGHRHSPEIRQELTKLNGTVEPQITFVPHLVPMTRGILVTCYASLQDSTSDEVRALYQDFYSGEPFVRVVDNPPMTKHTLGNNDCVVYPTVDQQSNRLIVISCVDNLVKGAAGQAVQNMNVMFGMDESQSLRQLALYP